ncbi:endocuticle structural glycoprotein ABD-4-like [Ctenocephalides felis]|uniref:endocuticle structural glycoprotein ABD-4-like n=1 Tax=Ctenocephalides felis TaxID=7515 RepID=UPI000E6E2DB5|nr:endocuticle structural glycoprotein ABD-4-like [Ctenocephalides felis]XP_026472533.1 endocuticle structural glycoprotein ABD-4-like [Ctenocephalides felis]
MRIVILCSILVSVLAAPQRGGGGDESQATIIRQNFDLQPDGSYISSYETSNGIKSDEQGNLKRSSDPQGGDVVVVQGAFSYTSPDGTPIQLNYVADDVLGFVPQGAHLPTPPPIPPEIQKALDYLATLPSTTERNG